MFDALVKFALTAYVAFMVAWFVTDVTDWCCWRVRNVWTRLFDK